MIDNPFTPVFGGKPDSFFGRRDLLDRFERALEVRGSDDRALFFTGTRGSGKTALLEQLSMRAAKAGWKTIDVGAEQALQSFYRQLTQCDELTETLAPSLEVKVLGSGGSVAGKSTAKTTRYATADVTQLFQRTCEKQKRGIFVSVDEIQKVPSDDVVSLCEAFQMASRKGLDVALVVAGLPYAHEKIIHEDGCTFMRRAAHEKLNLLDISEVREAYQVAFSRMGNLKTEKEAFAEMVHHSSGHPYMMQLLGYYVIEYLNQHGSKKPVVTAQTVEAVAPVALEVYERRALRPLLDELSEGERGYLRAMAEVSDATFVSRTGDVAEALRRTVQQANSWRQGLIDKGVIVSAGHGVVRFAIPYLRAYVGKPTGEEANLEQLEAWGV